MPELPEVECVKRSLEPVLIGAAIGDVQLHRHDIVSITRRNGEHNAARLNGVRCRRADLLLGSTITRLVRHGKQLAIINDRGAAVCVHLGMSGQLRYVPRGRHLQPRDHVHCVWRLNGSTAGRLVFRDPRRFGRLWAIATAADLEATHWHRLGPDALTIDSNDLAARLKRTTRAVKAALLDQAVIAGLGNIYVDECLFQVGVHPLTPCPAIEREQVERLATVIRATLCRAVEAGGSTIRSYMDSNGEAGQYALEHAVYGRAGQTCRECGRRLDAIVVAQRTTVVCSSCQPWRGAVA